MSLNLDKTDLIDNTLIITNDDGSITCIPEQGATSDELALFEEFRQAYPDSKPQVIVEPSIAVPSQEDRIKALEDALLILMGGQ